MTLIADKEQIITAYSYDRDDQHLIGSFEYHWAVGTGLAAQSTNIKPPAAKVGLVQVFDEEAQKWSQVEDHRLKTAFSTETKSAEKVDYIGKIKDGFTLLEPTSRFDTWTGTEWKDQRTDEEKETERLMQFLPLTRRQFKLALNSNDQLETVESKINQIDDPKQKALIQIEYMESEKFERQSESVKYMINMLDLTAEQVDAMWLQAMTL